MTKLHIAVPVLLCISLLGGTETGRAQSSSGPARMTFKIGAGYDQGNFGEPDLSRALYVPVSLRYNGRSFDLGVGSAFQYIDSTGNVRVIDGSQTQTGGAGGAVRTAGAGDTIVKGRIYAFTPESDFMPAITPFVKVKVPTASADRELGTGKTDYGLGVELDHPLGPVAFFGDMSYTLIGNPTGLDLRNRPAASVGIAGKLARGLTASGVLDWRRSLIAGNPNPTELAAAVSYRTSPAVTVSPNAFIGLSDGSSNFGIGMQISIAFARPH